MTSRRNLGNNPTYSDTLTALMLKPSGNTGATQATRYAGATTSGAPASGTYAVGDFVIAQNGVLWICTSAGTPGTWNSIGTPVAATATRSDVAGSATDVTILASNSSRLGATVYNESNALLYLLVGSGTSSATNYTVQLSAGGYYEVPFNYTGVIKGLWASATGNARVTEYTA